MTIKILSPFIGIFLLCATENFAQPTAILNWAKRIGGTGADRSRGMVVDNAGNIYTTGYYSGTVDFDPGAGVANLVSVGSSDIFISKLDANGNFVWAKSVGGSGADSPMGIAVDASGNVYITGGFATTADFDPGPGTFNMTSAGQTDIYIAKYNASGDFVWAKGIIGGTWFDHGYDILVDGSGNVHVVGRFYYQGGARDFDPGPGTFFLTADWEDIFILKLDNNGNFLWAKDMGNVLESRGYSIALDASGNIYTTGYFLGTVDFDPGAGTYNLTSVGGSTDWDVFYSKLDANGNFVWARAMVNSTSTYYSDGYYGKKIAVDASGNVYSCGRYSGTTDFDFGAGTYNLTPIGGYDIYLMKMTTNGDFVWANSMGGSGYDEGFSLSLGNSGDIYLTGFFVNTVDFDPGAGTFNLTAAGTNDDIFVSKFDANGNFTWARSMGGTLDDQGSRIATNLSGEVYVSGWFQGTADFDPSACTLNLTSAGSDEIFIAKLTQITATPLMITSTSLPSAPVGTTITISGTGFSTTPANNTVTFNSTAALVTASTATSITTTVPVGATTGLISVTVNCVTVQSATNFTVIPSPVVSITTQPSPSVVCVGANSTFITAATGTTNITYQWQYSSSLTGTYNDITNGSGYSNVATAVLTVNTTGNFGAGFYRCKVNGDFAPTVFTNAAQLTVNPIPTAPTVTGASACLPSASLTLNASGGANGQYRWYTVPTGGTAIAGQTNSGFTTPSLSATTTYYVSIDNGNCESVRTPVVATLLSCTTPPTITAAPLSTGIGGTAELELVPLISTFNNPLDINSITVIVQPPSGAIASITSGKLLINYAGISFSGKESVTVRACDNNGNCATQQFEIEVEGDVIVFNALSPGGANPTFVLQYIDIIPETKNNVVTIFDRWQNEVWRGENYNNTSVVFKGESDGGNDLPTGTYFYKIEFAGGKKMRTGFISLKR